MGLVLIPVIATEDYDAFRRILGKHMPNTVDEWEHLLNDRSLKGAQGGDVIRNVNVNSDEFFRYLNATGAAYDLDAFYVFAGQKSGGKNY